MVNTEEPSMMILLQVEPTVILPLNIGQFAADEGIVSFVPGNGTKLLYQLDAVFQSVEVAPDHNPGV